MPSKKPLYYSDYLKLDDLLNLQKPVSSCHDEMLFIITHQTYELWFKQLLMELISVRSFFQAPQLQENRMGLLVSRLERACEIVKLLVHQVDVLETMTPLDFLDFRSELTPASGFQSFQFRQVLVVLGLPKNHWQGAATRLNSPHRKLLTQEANRLSLFDGVEKWLERAPLFDAHGNAFWSNYQKAVEAMLLHDRNVLESHPELSPTEKKRELRQWKDVHEHFHALFDARAYAKLQKAGVFRISQQAMQSALVISLYRDEPLLQLPFRVLTSLMNLDETLTTWRHRHAQMALRMIGNKIGTGGSSGYAYLSHAVESQKLFADFFQLATFLIPRQSLPPLPQAMRTRFQFQHQEAHHGDAIF